MMRVKKNHHKAFTLIEVLISIGLLGIIITALFSTVSMMRSSNTTLYNYLQKSKKITEATKVLYRDIVASDGNITIKKDDFTRLCMSETKNSLYGLTLAKVCWVVLKKENTLARVEGNNYTLPTRFDDQVEVNSVMKHVEIFDIYHTKDKLLVFIKQKNEAPISFMIQGVYKPVPKKIKPKKPNKSSTKKPTKRQPGKPVKTRTSPIKNTSPITDENTVVPPER